MNRPIDIVGFRAGGFLAAFGFLLVSGCAGKPAAKLPDLNDPPSIASVARTDFARTLPGTGVVDTSGALELDLGRWEAGQVKAGQEARAWVDGSGAPLSCRVTRVLPDAAGGGQSLVWLSPDRGQALPAGAFVSASITTRVYRGALSVPDSALFVLNGRTVVMVPAPEGGSGLPYVSRPVRVGVRSFGRAQILSGLKAGDKIVVRGGIGYLYPEFKAQGAG